METQSQSSSAKKLTPFEQAANVEMFFVEVCLKKIDSIKAGKMTKEFFMDQFSRLWDQYTIMLDEKIAPERAQFICLQQVKKHMEANRTQLEMNLQNSKVTELKGGKPKK